MRASHPALTPRCVCLNHLGVVKALLHYEMLPKIITGSSAGSLIGAAIATRTDMELAAFLDLPAAELADFFQPW